MLFSTLDTLSARILLFNGILPRDKSARKILSPPTWMLPDKQKYRDYFYYTNYSTIPIPGGTQNPASLKKETESRQYPAARLQPLTSFLAILSQTLSSSCQAFFKKFLETVLHNSSSPIAEIISSSLLITISPPFSIIISVSEFLMFMSFRMSSGITSSYYFL